MTSHIRSALWTLLCQSLISAVFSNSAVSWGPKNYTKREIRVLFNHSCHSKSQKWFTLLFSYQRKNGCLFNNDHRFKLTNGSQMVSAYTITPKRWMLFPEMDTMSIAGIRFTLFPISEHCLFS